MARVGRPVRTGRTDWPFLAVRSEINGGDSSASFSSFRRDCSGGYGGERWRGSPEARPTDGKGSALGEKGRGGLRESKGTVGLVGGSPEKRSATRGTAAGACRTWRRRLLQGVFSTGLL